MITLGGKTDAELGFTVMSPNTLRPNLPDTRDYTTVISGRHGAYDFGADLGPRAFLLNCWFNEDLDDEDIETAVIALNAHLLDNWGKPKTLELIFDWQPTRHYDVRYSGKLAIDTSEAMARRKFTLPLIAFDPHAFGEEEEVEYLIEDSPVSLWYTVASGLNVPITIILDNEGLNTIEGFSFKTFDDIFDWSVYDE